MTPRILVWGVQLNCWDRRGMGLVERGVIEVLDWLMGTLCCRDQRLIKARVLDRVSEREGRELWEDRIVRSSA